MPARTDSPRSAAAQPTHSRLRLAGLVNALCLLSACGGGEDGGGRTTGPAQPAATPASLEVTIDTVTLYRGRTTALSAVVRDSRGGTLAGARVTWSATDPQVATVDSVGVVRAVAVGTTVVRASIGALTDSARVRVERVPVARVALSAVDTLWVGDTARVQATVTDLDGATVTDRPVTWTVSDTTVAQLDVAGRLVGRRPGAVTLTAHVDTARTQRSTTVTPVPLASITLSAPDSAVRVGETLSLTAALRDARGRAVTDRAVTWASADPAALSVTDGRNGTAVVRATRPGPVAVTARADGRQAALTVGAYRAGFVSRLGTRLLLDGKPFHFGGTNASIYARMDPASMDRNLANFASVGTTVLRIWAYSDRGSLDGSVPNIAKYMSNPDAVYFQYWDPRAGRPAYNEGSNGLQRLDLAVAKARARGMKLVMTLTNNWADWGGVDQYNLWYGLRTHDAFYTDPRARQAYRDWVATLINRTNSVTGVPYRDDPTILAWELGNELFCFASSDDPERTTAMPTSPSCNAAVVTRWVQEMASYVKELDSNHLVSVGNIGFLNAGKGGFYSNEVGDDFEAALAVPAVDFGTFHLYHEDASRFSDTPVAWGAQWIRDHMAVARRLGKPAILEEFGSHSASRDPAFQSWLDVLRAEDGAGWLVWQLTEIRPDGESYVPGMPYNVGVQGATADLLRREAQRWSTRTGASTSSSVRRPHVRP